MKESLEKLLEMVGQTSQLGVFLAVAIGSFIILFIMFLAGSLGAGHDVDHGGGVGHDADHPDHGDGNATVSIFSPKIFAVFTLAFGCCGAIACLAGIGGIYPSLCGLGGGLAFGAMAYIGLSALYKQQANSIVPTQAALGKTGSITTSIEGSGFGEIEVNINGDNRTYTAISKGGKSIPRGAVVKIVQCNGGVLIVENA